MSCLTMLEKKYQKQCKVDKRQVFLSAFLIVPNDTAFMVEISYLTPDGTGNVTFTDTVPANSRKTFSMADKGINGRAAVMVTSKTPDKKIMVERAMYWNNRGAGTDTVGGFSDN